MDILYAVLFVCVLVAGRGFIPWRLVAGWHLAGYWTRCGWAWLCETNAVFREQERARYMMPPPHEACGYTDDDADEVIAMVSDPPVLSDAEVKRQFDDIIRCNSTTDRSES